MYYVGHFDVVDFYCWCGGLIIYDVSFSGMWKDAHRCDAMIDEIHVDAPYTNFSGARLVHWPKKDSIDWRCARCSKTQAYNKYRRASWKFTRI